MFESVKTREPPVLTQYGSRSTRTTSAGLLVAGRVAVTRLCGNAIRTRRISSAFAPAPARSTSWRQRFNGRRHSGGLSRLRTTTTLHLVAYTELSIIAREGTAFHFAARASLSSSSAGMRVALGTIDKIVKHEAYTYVLRALTKCSHVRKAGLQRPSNNTASNANWNACRAIARDAQMESRAAVIDSRD